MEVFSMNHPDKYTAKRYDTPNRSRAFTDTVYSGESYKVIDEEADAVRQDNTVLFYPYLSGASAPDSDPEATGAFYGINLSTKRGNLAAAVMEGVAFQIRRLLEAMDAYGNVDRLVIFGGGAKSKLWCQIIADATGLTLTVLSTAEAAGAGAAILAAKACGTTLSPLAEAFTYEPSEWKEVYEERYQKYCDIKNKLWKGADSQ
jgi:xylulokinase